MIENNTKRLEVNPIDIASDRLEAYQVPSFVNHVNLWWFGQDIYIDLAVWTVEQMLAMKDPAAKVDIGIYDRYVMSIATVETLRSRLNTLYSQLVAAGLLKDAETKSQTAGAQEQLS